MTHDALFQAILAAPGDDVPRLVYADWLEEHGDDAERDRARFIRAQIDLERLHDRDPRKKARQRLSEALPRARRWDARLPDWLTNAAYYRRGLIASVVM